ncbi:hypothetical protein [Plesiomonas shigelloides]|uniref:hypothetical protein n=1 Tax=Plesiomonas shigelloides TaxID=703 RepID=UPI00387F0D2B
MEYRQLSKEEITALREEMKAAGEWAKTILEETRRQTLANGESCPSKTKEEDFVRTKFNR